jgi:hypothetical protein
VETYFSFLYQSDISDFLIVHDYHCEAERHSVGSHVLWHFKLVKDKKVKQSRYRPGMAQRVSGN